MDDIVLAWKRFLANSASQYPAAWTVPLQRILDATDIRFNPVRYAPETEQALAVVLEAADTDDWRVERLGDFATVFNGPRFKRPFADDGVTQGVSIRPMFTPKAFFEERGESVKYLDVSKASRTQRKQLEVLELKPNWILIVDSGTAGKLLGRVGMTTAVHDGAIGNNNLIRVVIEDAALRDYVYQFLRSELGQQLLLRNVYGTNQDHIEPDDVKDIPIPIPCHQREIDAIHERVRRLNELREETANLDAALQQRLTSVFTQAGLMPQRERKLRPDVNEIAFETVQAASGASPKPVPPGQRERPDPIAAVRGRKGGKKGGKARAAKLSAAKHSEIAKQAAKKRLEAAGVNVTYKRAPKLKKVAEAHPELFEKP